VDIISESSLKVFKVNISYIFKVFQAENLSSFKSFPALKNYNSKGLKFSVSCGASIPEC